MVQFFKEGRFSAQTLFKIGFFFPENGLKIVLENLNQVLWGYLITHILLTHYHHAYGSLCADFISRMLQIEGATPLTSILPLLHGVSPSLPCSFFILFVISWIPFYHLSLLPFLLEFSISCHRYIQSRLAFYLPPFLPGTTQFWALTVSFLVFFLPFPSTSEYFNVCDFCPVSQLPWLCKRFHILCDNLLHLDKTLV